MRLPVKLFFLGCCLVSAHAAGRVQGNEDGTASSSSAGLPPPISTTQAPPTGQQAAPPTGQQPPLSTGQQPPPPTGQQPPSSTGQQAPSPPQSQNFAKSPSPTKSPNKKPFGFPKRPPSRAQKGPAGPINQKPARPKLAGKPSPLQSNANKPPQEMPQTKSVATKSIPDTDNDTKSSELASKQVEKQAKSDYKKYKMLGKLLLALSPLLYKFFEVLAPVYPYILLVTYPLLLRYLPEILHVLLPREKVRIVMDWLKSLPKKFKEDPKKYMNPINVYKSMPKSVKTIVRAETRVILSTLPGAYRYYRRQHRKSRM